MEENKKKRGRMIGFVFPLLLAFAAASRVVHDMRTVDFLRVFASGMLVGVSLMGITEAVRAKKTPSA